MISNCLTPIKFSFFNNNNKNWHIKCLIKNDKQMKRNEVLFLVGNYNEK